MADDLKNKLAERAESKPRTKAQTIYDLLEAQKPQIARALPRHITAERFARIALTVIRQNPKLLECKPQSLLGALMVSAQLGLEPGPLGHAYLVPYKDEVQFQCGYQGYIELAYRSGRIQNLVAREVCEGDEFEFEYGLEEKLIHRPSLKERGEAYAYYGVARFKDGGHLILVMSKSDVEKYRLRSKQPDGQAWKNDYDAMAKKTVIRRMAPYLPKSVEFAQALELDESIAHDWDAERKMINVTPSYSESDDEKTVVPVDGGDESTEPRNGSLL